MVIMNNISDKIMQDRFNKIQTYKDKILNSISHNLKTPLNAINLFLLQARN